MPETIEALNMQNIVRKNYFFWFFKRVFDLLICLFLLPVLFALILLIVFFNLFYNKGSVFYIQKRMGKNCKPFYAIKFRTMRNIDVIEREYHDPLEEERITRLGRLLRKTKIDELPQILNVLMGEMSLIGPRPDYYEHALSFLENVPSYYLRHAIRPGISGLSQIRLGYAEGLSDTKKKAKVDLFYIKNASFIFDIKIFFGTIFIILKCFKN
jgi:lipopolysaccharide/colanic/teichoic acid biosynthesis glycosyltransferase